MRNAILSSIITQDMLLEWFTRIYNWKQHRLSISMLGQFPERTNGNFFSFFSASRSLCCKFLLYSELLAWLLQKTFLNMWCMPCNSKIMNILKNFSVLNLLIKILRKDPLHRIIPQAIVKNPDINHSMPNS